MTRFKFKIELLLTVLCLFMVYTLATRDRAPSREPITTLELSSPEIYRVANNSHSPDTLKTLAREEARRMLETGDTELYKEELNKNGLLMRVMGY